jgi:regulator of replication initiation timing
MDVTNEEAYAEIKPASEIFQHQNPSYAFAITEPPTSVRVQNEFLFKVKPKHVLCVALFGFFVVAALSMGCGSIVISLNLQSKLNLLNSNMVDLLSEISRLKIIANNTANFSILESEINHLKESLNFSYLHSEAVILNLEVEHLRYNLSRVSEAAQTAVDSFWQPTGLFYSNPATSCASIFRSLAVSVSGFYWIRASNGSAVNVYCDMNRSCGGIAGGWMRVAKLDMTNSSNHCPNNFRLVTESGVRSCGIDSSYASCSSMHFDAGGITFDKVCGQVIAYQWGTPDAFTVRNRGNLSLDSIYVDGISLTYGNPRRHIWTFAASNDENPNVEYNCPCVNAVNPGLSFPPAFINSQEYFCDTGSADMQSLILYADDPLWDGAGCGRLSICCSLNNPPWFYKQLESASNENIEMRVCSDEPRTNEDISIKLYELYIQ